MDDATTPVAAHYGRPGIVESIRAALREAGRSPDVLQPEDLAPVDQFHTRGREATLDLARLAELTGGEQVLDVGGGLGGPARTLASTLGCHVTVLDLTPEFREAGEELTRWVGLGDRVSFETGDGTALPFEPASFDVVWTQHLSMNVPDKRKLFAEACRVLRPGGRLAIHEISAGSGEPLDFPVPWASRAELSFLLPERELRALVREAGVHERIWVDVTDPSLAWVEARLAAAGSGPALGLQVLLGPAAGAAFVNLRRGLAERRLRVVEAVFDR
ncbi:MAG: methyltransferase domain-containing protein [Gemmatimonadales bacterium]